MRRARGLALLLSACLPCLCGAVDPAFLVGTTTRMCTALDIGFNEVVDSRGDPLPNPVGMTFPRGSPQLIGHDPDMRDLLWPAQAVRPQRRRARAARPLERGTQRPARAPHPARLAELLTALLVRRRRRPTP